MELYVPIPSKQHSVLPSTLQIAAITHENETQACPDGLMLVCSFRQMFFFKNEIIDYSCVVGIRGDVEVQI